MKFTNLELPKGLLDATRKVVNEGGQNGYAVKDKTTQRILGRFSTEKEAESYIKELYERSGTKNVSEDMLKNSRYGIVKTSVPLDEGIGIGKQAGGPVKKALSFKNKGGTDVEDNDGEKGKKEKVVINPKLDEKELTPAEKKKREDIAKAMERENPDMPKDKKMAIATDKAKKVAEENERAGTGEYAVSVNGKYVLTGLSVNEATRKTLLLRRKNRNESVKMIKNRDANVGGMVSEEHLNEDDDSGKEAYKELVKTLLKKYNVSSPDKLTGDDKKKFYDELDKKWNSDDERGEDGKVKNGKTVDEEVEELDELAQAVQLKRDIHMLRNKIAQIKGDSPAAKGAKIPLEGKLKKAQKELDKLKEENEWSNEYVESINEEMLSYPPHDRPVMPEKPKKWGMYSTGVQDGHNHDFRYGERFTMQSHGHVHEIKYDSETGNPVVYGGGKNAHKHTVMGKINEEYQTFDEETKPEKAKYQSHMTTIRNIINNRK